MWLLSGYTPLSFDSRYYGAVRTIDIVAGPSRFSCGEGVRSAEVAMMLSDQKPALCDSARAPLGRGRSFATRAYCPATFAGRTEQGLAGSASS